MNHLFFPDALLPDGWARSVRVTVAGDGSISGVTAGAESTGCDIQETVAVPGVPNVHSHAFQRAMAGLAERGSTRGDTFWSWRERMYDFLQRLGPEDVEAVAAQLQVEFLRHGYTAVTEFHYLRNAPDGRPYSDPVELGRRILAAADLSGIGVTLLPVVYRTSDFGGAPPSPGQVRFVAEVDELLDDVTMLKALTAADPNRRVSLALHSLRAVTPTDLARTVAAFRSFDAEGPIHIHVAEQLREVEACVAWSGARPMEWLLSNADVNERWCLIHSTHLTTSEVTSLAATGAVVGLCPTTEGNLGDGVFPFVAFRDEGGAWGIGTDSHVSVSPTADLRMLEYVQRLVTHERNVAAGREDRSTGRALLEAAWSGGAQASGRTLGQIAPGARADLVALDPNHPCLVGRQGDELLDSWIFSGEDTPVRDVMVGGRWVVRDGRHVEQEAIAAAFTRTARRLRSSDG